MLFDMITHVIIMAKVSTPSDIRYERFLTELHIGTSDIVLKSVESGIMSDIELTFLQISDTRHMQNSSRLPALKSVKTSGKPEQRGRRRKARAGQPDHDSQSRTARAGQPVQDSQRRTTSAGKRVQDS
jgi:hypothetical protein